MNHSEFAFDRQPTFEDDRCELAQILRGRGWVTAAEIERLRPNWASRDHRYIRRLAQPRRGEPMQIISGPGTKGYHFAPELPVEEIDRASNLRKAQGRELFRSGVQLSHLAALRRKTESLQGTHHPVPSVP